MEKLEVKSSNVKSLEYDVEKQILIVTYHGVNKDSKYAYYDFPAKAWDGVKSFKGSYGSAIRKIVKGFTYKKLI